MEKTDYYWAVQFWLNNRFLSPEEHYILLKI